MRFIQQGDYAMQVKSEIIRLLTAQEDGWYGNAKLIRAEQTAIAQIRNRIGKRYDCGVILQPLPPPAVGGDGDEQIDSRDQWIVTITIDLALYHLYSQAAVRDVPAHRQQRYQDALDWLKDVGNGSTPADLPPIIDELGEPSGDFRLNSREPENHKW
jgi:phage gp36-like protein